MKKETKELIDWMKDFLCTEKSDCKGNTYNFVRFDKAVDFLDSLPEIESKLCHGGYIQDKNGIPCCHGDTVHFDPILGLNFKSGKLLWSANQGMFVIKNDAGEWEIKEVLHFEKIYKGEQK